MDTDKKREKAETDCVFIQNTKKSHIKSIRSKSVFFNSEIKYKVRENMIVFEKITIGYNGKTVSPQKLKSGWWLFTIVGENVPIGKIFFEEESSEDIVIIRLKEFNS